jgi:hypothetical protein
MASIASRSHRYPSELDDGLLTSSEVAQLKLNDRSSPRNAYPGFWGPFAPIGEGAAR